MVNLVICLKLKTIKVLKNRILFALENYKLSIIKAELGYDSLDRFNIKNTLGKLKKRNS